MSSSIKLGEIPLDSQQTLKKAWCDDRDAHRVLPLNLRYNRVIPAYNADGTLSTICYFFDDQSEVTKVTFNADSCASLNGKIFDIREGRDATLYKLFYIVDGGSIVPCDSGTTKFIAVCLVSCDFDKVVALATQNAILAHPCAGGDFTIVNKAEVLEITAITPGATTDAADVSTGFAFCILTQGVTTLSEKLTFTYDACGQLILTQTNSGENVSGYDIVDIRNINATRDNIAIQCSCGNELSINTDGSINAKPVVPDTASPSTETPISITEVEISAIAGQSFIFLSPTTTGRYHYRLTTGVTTDSVPFTRRQPAIITDWGGSVFVRKASGSGALEVTRG